MQVREGDELQAVGGILDVVDNNVAFLRTTGYRAAASDVFVNNGIVRRLGLRSGDAITGQVKVSGPTHTHGNGRNRRKYNQLVQVDTVTVSYTHLTLPTIHVECRSRWSPYH